MRRAQVTRRVLHPAAGSHPIEVSRLPKEKEGEQGNGDHDNNDDDDEDEEDEDEEWQEGGR
ncbi:hypothetical protein ESCO_000820 [Escovopsis weberi]|uniref:Uncharacterized protein n=1 Tax=Escovopsis weberi TaxID=150374 RepID=A0A0M8MUJ9_ESCWE|nr:hypothetical protein ESCO_000820 [Escovopsis weberi]